nr:hypothetical protein [Zobellella denitrificans]
MEIVIDKKDEHQQTRHDLRLTAAFNPLLSPVCKRQRRAGMAEHADHAAQQQQEQQDIYIPFVHGIVGPKQCRYIAAQMNQCIERIELLQQQHPQDNADPKGKQYPPGKNGQNDGQQGRQ